MDSPALIRNVAICGHLHHGKTSFTDLLIEQTHEVSWDPAKQVRYTDTRKDEQQRGVSIKSCPVSLVLQVSVCVELFQLIVVVAFCMRVFLPVSPSEHNGQELPD